MKRAKKLTKNQRKEAERAARDAAASKPKTRKPLKTKTMFKLSFYLERKEQKKHAKHHHHH